MHPRYYHTTVGQDHIPDPWKWVDVWVPPILMALAILCNVALMAYAMASLGVL